MLEPNLYLELSFRVMGNMEVDIEIAYAAG